MKLQTVLSTLLILLQLRSSSAIFWKSATKNAIELLSSHIRTNGGIINFEVKRMCKECVRGVYAPKDLKAGDLIAKVPFRLGINIANDETTSLALKTYQLIVKMHQETGFNRTYTLWWETQPSLDDILVPEMLTEEQRPMLQSDSLSNYVRELRSYAWKVFNGDFDGLPRLNEVIAPGTIDFDTFLWINGLVLSREFAFHFNGKPKIFLMPIIDMYNDCTDNECTAYRQFDEDNTFIYAKRDVTAGEQLTMAYQPFITHRADMSLIIYGFAMISDPPLLAAIDRPDFLEASIFRQTPTQDEVPETLEEMLAEIDRCKRILDGLPTSLEEDEALLQSGRYSKDWKTNEILKYRIARKRALHYRIGLLSTLSESKSEL